MADMELIESIRRTESDIRQTRGQIKELTEELDEIITNADGYKRTADLVEELAAARKELNAELAEDRDYQAASDAAGELKFKLHDLQDILSVHLIEYREATKADYIEEEDSKKVRHIEVTAKLRKPEYHQEEMFDAKAEAAAEIEKHGSAARALTARRAKEFHESERTYEISSNKSKQKLVIDKEGIHSESIDGKSLAAGEGKE